MTTPFIVDASVAIKWIIQEERSDTADALVGKDLHAPDWMRIECAQILWKKIQRNQMSAKTAMELHRDLAHVALTFHPAATNVEVAFALASELRHSVYDCLYLSLALRLEGVCVTDDKKFFLAASAKKKYKSHVLLLEETVGTLYH